MTGLKIDYKMTNRSVMKKRKLTTKSTKRRDEILKAARILFSKKGYSGTTLDDIAKRVGITKGTIYLYFKNKEDLIASVVECELAKMLVDFNLLRGTGIPVEKKIGQIVRRIFERVGEGRELYRLLDPDIIRMYPSLRAVFRRRLKPSFEKSIRVLQETIEEGINGGVFKPYDPFKIALIIHAMIFGLMKSWSLGAKIESTDKKLLEDLVLTGILKKAGGSR